MRLIRNIVEPKRLLVIWQAPDKNSNQATGKRFIVGEILSDNGSATLHYYDNEATREAKALGFAGFTAYPYDAHKGFNDNLIEVLSKRLPPSSRTDYEDYLQSFRIAPNANGISTLSLLAYTGGKLAGDGFTFAHTFEGAEPPFDFTFEIAGFRYCEGMNFQPLTLLQDCKVGFKDDSSNTHDKEAIMVEYEGKKLGYAPKGINNILKILLASYSVDAYIEKINGTPERPNIMVYVTVT